MIVPYSQYMGFIISGFRPLYVHLFNNDLTFTFENYVKSQLHLQVVPDLYNRDIFTYAKALEYLRGNDQYLLECSYVLKYFYQDMTNMICNLLKVSPDIESKISVVSGLGRNSKIPTKKVELAKVVSQLDSSMSGSSYVSDDETIYSDGVFVKFTYDEVDKLKPNNLLALASILLYYGNDSTETYVVEVV